MEFSSRQLRAFQLIAQHRSFTRAAEALFITTSGLSLLIRELETQLGFRLVDRTTRHVVTTAHGNELLAATQPHLQALDATMSRIGQTAEGTGHVLSVGTTPLVAANILSQAIREFRSQRPDLRIRLFDAHLGTILKKVEAGKLDMDLGVFKSLPGIRRTPFFRFSLEGSTAVNLSLTQTARLPQTDGKASEYGPVQIHHLLGEDRRTNVADGQWQVMKR